MVNKKAYAKINLYLEVLNKRDDGYHNIKSIFSRIDVFDNLLISPLKKKTIKVVVKNNVNPVEIAMEDNIVYKAANLFLSTFMIDKGVEIFIEKNIPIGSGLGGGSSDCASTLIGLGEIFGVYNHIAISEIGKMLGSDVAFFLSQTPLALCEGRGEIVNKIEVKAKLPYIVLVFPDIHIPTKKVYQNLKYDYEVSLDRLEKFCKELLKESEIDFSNLLFNRLESSTFEISKKVLDLKKKLTDLGLYSLMSGSGSSVFGLTYDYEKAVRSYGILKDFFPFVYITKIV